jgi:CheY-like chemotaxis protein
MPTRRILIVDDERLTRVSLADFLQEAGYETTTTGDGESALQLQQEWPFDVCIVDIRMPDMDGVETILALHRAAPGSRFIVYTGSPQFTLPPVLKKIGLSERYIVRKPVLDMNIFVALIEQVANGE